MSVKSALNQYKSVGLNSLVASANPHKLVNLLFNGLQDKLRDAKLAIQAENIALKGSKIGEAISIIEYLRVSLDPGVDLEFAERLAGLYSYFEETLLQANLECNVDKIDEVAALVQEIKEGWEGIPEEYRT